MATSKTTSTGSTSTGDPERTRIVSLTALADKVDELAKAIGGGAGKAPEGSRETSPPAGAGSVDEQVRAAVAAAREQDAARDAEAKRQKEIDDRIKGLEERTEKRPVERSRLTKWMWGEE